jgi:hypothetical protein
MQKISYVCDVGPANNSCGAPTHGHHILLPCDPSGTEDGRNTRVDLCDYHATVLFKTLRGELRLPRDPVEAACP